MTKYNAKSERIKREYFRFQKHATGKADTTLNSVRKALDRFESYTGHKDFVTFNREQAIAFKKHLASQKNQRTGEPISKATMLTTVAALQDFFRWLAFQRGYKSLHVPDIEYLNLTDKETSIAKAAKYRNFPTLAQIHKTIFSMPAATDIQRRDRALIAFAIATGMRDNALDWVRELLDQKLYGLNDPVFPRTTLGHDGNKSFTVQGLEPVCWSNATPIRRVFREAFEGAGLPYFNPHSFRHTLGHMTEQFCPRPEQLRAWSQNLGHENIRTTLSSYGKIDPYRQGEVMKALKMQDTGKKDKMDIIIQKLAAPESR